MKINTKQNTLTIANRKKENLRHTVLNLHKNKLAISLVHALHFIEKAFLSTVESFKST